MSPAAVEPGLFERALDAFGDAQQAVFEGLIQPVLFGAGLGNLVEDGYRATGWLLVGLLQLVVMLTLFGALERWRPVEPRDDAAAVRTDVVYTLLHRLGVVRVALFFMVDPLWDALGTRLRMAGVPQLQLDALVPGLAGHALVACLVYLLLSSLFMISSSGVMWSQETKDGLLRHNPTMMLIDAFSSSEAIGLGQSVSTAGGSSGTAKFQLGANAKVIADDGHEVQPGSGEIGRVAAEHLAHWLARGERPIPAVAVPGATLIQRESTVGKAGQVALEAVRRHLAENAARGVLLSELVALSGSSDEGSTSTSTGTGSPRPTSSGMRTARIRVEVG